MFVECDLSLLEINPLVVTKTGQLFVWMAKLILTVMPYIVNLN